jgi:FkbM family methyltransferase
MKINKSIKYLKYHFIKNFSNYKSLNGIDKKLLKYINYKNGYFVELGANDGINQSNTYYFEKKLDWMGILIEPILHNYLNCVSNRSKRNKYHCKACVSFEYKEEIVPLYWANLMTTSLAKNLKTFNVDSHLSEKTEFKYGSKGFIKIGAEAATLTSILVESDAPRLIDLLSLDVEGDEIQVLSGLDHSVFRFRYIVVESRNFEEISKLLQSQGYHFVEALTHHDYLFKDALNQY